MNYDFDLFVIGAGSGGVRASRVSAQLGARVAIAEELYVGGTCVNVGCVPKKLFVYASEFPRIARSSAGFGWTGHEADFSWQVLRDNTRDEIARLNKIYLSLLSNAGVTFIDGLASLEDAHTVKVGDQRYTAEKILIATGAWPNKPNFPGAEHCLTSNDIFSLDELPESILVHGGGYIAVEFAGIFEGLGRDVELVYRDELFLRSFDTEVRQFLAQQMRLRNLQLTFNTNIREIEKQADGKLKVYLQDRHGGASERLVDAVFSAVGRSPKIDSLGLGRIGVETYASGHIKVDDNFKTTVDNIYALGDAVGRMELTPVALAEGMALAKHWFAGERINLDYANIPTAIFSQPNVATLGLSEDAALGQGKDFLVYASEFRPMKNTLGGSEERTLMKLIVEKESDLIIGAHMVGPDAGEIMQGIAIAVTAGATKTHFDQTIGIHPTSAEEFVTMREPRKTG